MTYAVRVFIFLFLVYFGWKISVEDFKYRRIQNKKLKFAAKILGFAFLTLLSVTLISAVLPYIKTESLLLHKLLTAAQWTINPSLKFIFYWKFLIHSLLVSVFAVVLWKIKIWPAADAKLYMIFGSSIPLISPNITQFPNKLFFVLLINIFFPAAIFFILVLLVKFILNTLSGKYDGSFKNVAKNISLKLNKFKTNPQNAAKWGFLIVNYFILFSISQIFRMHTHNFFAGLFSNQVLVFVVLFLLWDKIYGYMMKKRTTVLFLAVMGVYLFSGAFLFPQKIKTDLLNGVAMVVRFGMLVILLKTFISRYFENTEKVRIETDTLTRGMVLAKSTISDMRRDNDFYSVCFEDIYPDGLTDRQVKKIKEWGKMEKVDIAKTKPFALWICAGCVLTAVIKMDLFNFVKIKFPLFAETFSKLMGYQ